MRVLSRHLSSALCVAVGPFLAATVFASSGAHAVSARVKVACASDYFAFCRAHPVGSPGVRQCMRAAGAQLSKRCVSALIADGEVSEAEVARRSAALR